MNKELKPVPPLRNKRLHLTSKQKNILAYSFLILSLVYAFVLAFMQPDNFCSDEEYLKEMEKTLRDAGYSQYTIKGGYEIPMKNFNYRNIPPTATQCYYKGEYYDKGWKTLDVKVFWWYDNGRLWWNYRGV